MSKTALLFSALFAFGCAPDEQILEDPTESSLDDGKADSAASTSTYYSARRDLRKCVSPLCGGYWVSRLNRAQTRCADGNYAAECYVGSIDVSGLGFSDDEQSTALNNATAELFRANIGSYDWNGNQIGALKVSEVWLNASSETVATGNYYRVDPNLIRCITTPCPTSYHEAKLNSTLDRTLSGFRGPFADKLAGQSEPVLASGVNKSSHGQVFLDASQFWTRVKPSIPAELFCNSDADCTFSAYTHEISSSSECYCPTCPNGLMNVSTEDLYRNSWEASCSTVRLTCPLPPCLDPGAATCVNNTCTRTRTPL